MRRILLALIVLSLPVRAEALTVFAAASLTDALNEISTLWQREGHQAPVMSYGASSTLARQIENGAPAEIFASADLQWMDYLAARSLIAPGTRRNVLRNTLVLITPSDRKTTITIGPGLDLSALLGSNGRLATGDPAHVPVGLYAQQALTNLGVWNAIRPRLAPTADVRAALVLVERGEAPAGIVYATDAAGRRGVSVAGVFPASSHAPILYPFAATKSGDNPEAREFLRFLQAPAARDVFTRRGFVVE